MVITALTGLDAEIVSADSRQVYRQLDIGTAKPTAEQRHKVPHHLVDCVDIDQPWNAARYGRMARDVIIKLLEEEKFPVVVGGSGLYIRALREGFFQGPGTDPAIRKNLVLQENRNGLAALYERLVDVDPESARGIHPNDAVRIIRALEVFEKTGVPISQWRRKGPYPKSKFSSSLVGLFRPRTELYRRIEWRVDQMMDQGLLDEVRGLLDSGYSPQLTSLSTVGYQEIIAHLQGHIDLHEAVDRLKRNTRQYAKRQMTWFGREQDILWFQAGQEQENLRQALAELHRGRRPAAEGLNRRRKLMRQSWSLTKASAAE
jgi:tRNA dimethylallyltransferase